MTAGHRERMIAFKRRLAPTRPALAHYMPEHLWNCSTLATSDAALLASRAQAMIRERKGVRPLLYALSSNCPAGHADRLFSLLKSSHNIGCLVDPPTTPGNPQYTLAVAYWNRDGPGSEPIAFRSQLTGKPKIALGREVKPDLDTNRDMPFDYNQSWSSQWGASATQQELPESLRNANDIDHVLLFSDDAPQGLMSALDQRYPKATKMGLIAASTPFITGLPFTMLQGSTLVSSGAVGIAWPKNLNTKFNLTAQYPGWEPMGSPHTVTHVQGNIILTLDDQPASRLLLQLLDAKGAIAKEDDFYFGFVPPSHGPQPCQAHEALSLAQITAGSPSKGRMAVDTEQPIKQGTRGQFYVRKKRWDELTPPANTKFSFETRRAGDRGQMLLDWSAGFHAASERGIVVGCPGSASWLSTVAGHNAFLSSDPEDDFQLPPELSG